MQDGAGRRRLRADDAGACHHDGQTLRLGQGYYGAHRQADKVGRLGAGLLGHGRGGRMKIEQDTAEPTAGVRHGRTLGSPVALSVVNRDYANWEERMNPWPVAAPLEAASY